MPKDWEHHKAEIERIYMVEGRTLKDVRNILRSQYRFDASIRAYRMKLDEWRLWKNNSKNQRRKTKTISRRKERTIDASGPQPNVPSALPSLPAHHRRAQADGLQVYGITVPNGAIEVQELLPLSSDLQASRGLEIMLLKWKPDGTFLKAALEYLRDNGYWFYSGSGTLDGRSIFHLIQEKTAPTEHRSLVKACLEANIKSQQGYFCENRVGLAFYFPPWLGLWAEACTLSSWKMAKATLGRWSILDSDRTIGTYFLECGLTVIAEGILNKNIEELEQMEARAKNPNHNDERLAEICLRESMDILGEFSNSGVDIDLKWYKRSLKISEWNDRLLAGCRTRQRKQSQQLEEYRQKFLQLKTLYQSVEDGDGMVRNLLNAADLLNKSKEILATVQCGDISLDGDLPSPRDSTPTALTQTNSSSELRDEMRFVLEDIYTRWRCGKDIGDHIEALLGKLVVWFSNPSDTRESFLTLISRVIPRIDQVSFTVTILTEIDDYHPYFPSEDELDWTIWHQFYTSSALGELMQRAGCRVLKLLLSGHIASEAVQMVLDAAVVLVGERYLWKLKAEIERGHNLPATDFDLLVYDKYRQEYMTILEMIQSRKLKVDQRWFAFLGTMLRWATTNWGDEVEISEEESGDDSVELDAESDSSEDEGGVEDSPI